MYFIQCSVWLRAPTGFGFFLDNGTPPPGQWGPISRATRGLLTFIVVESCERDLTGAAMIRQLTSQSLILLLQRVHLQKCNRRDKKVHVYSHIRLHHKSLMHAFEQLLSVHRDSITLSCLRTIKLHTSA